MITTEIKAGATILEINPTNGFSLEDGEIVFIPTQKFHIRNKDNTLDILDISTTTLNQELLSINIPLKIMDASNAATEVLKIVNSQMEMKVSTLQIDALTSIKMESGDDMTVVTSQSVNISSNVIELESSNTVNINSENVNVWGKNGVFLKASDGVNNVFASYAENQIDRLGRVYNDTIAIGYPAGILQLKGKAVIKNLETENTKIIFEDISQKKADEEKKETEFSEKIDELNQETDTLLEEIDKWQT